MHRKENAKTRMYDYTTAVPQKLRSIQKAKKAINRMEYTGLPVKKLICCPRRELNTRRNTVIYILDVKSWPRYFSYHPCCMYFASTVTFLCNTFCEQCQRNAMVTLKIYE